MADEEVVDSEQGTPEVETQAREMGWRPKEEFKGDDSKWVDAKTFVERGEHVLPIVKANADRLRKENQGLHLKQSQLEAAVADGQKAIAALEKYHQEDVKQKVDKARTDLKAQLVAAKKSGDVETEVDLTDQLSNLNAAETAAIDRGTAADAGTTRDTKRPPTKDYTKEPDYIAWKEDNEWFGADRARTAIAYQISAELRGSGTELKGRAFLDKVTEETNKEVARLGGGRQATRKVEASRGGAGGGNGGKTYADLPAEAKEACRSYEADLVGPNKRYKNAAEWHKSYAEQYFREV